MPTLTPATAATGTLGASSSGSGSGVAAAAGSGTLASFAAVNGDGLYCSETLACSDVDVICTDADGTNAAATATGSLVAA